MSGSNMLHTRMSVLRNSALPQERAFYEQLTRTFLQFITEQLVPLFDYVAESMMVQIEEEIHRPLAAHDMGLPVEEHRYVRLGKYYLPLHGTEIELLLDADGQVYQAYQCKECVICSRHLKVRKPHGSEPQYTDIDGDTFMRMLSRAYSDASRVAESTRESFNVSVQTLHEMF